MKINILADPLDFQSAGIHVFTRETIKELQKQNKDYFTIIRDGRNKEISFENSILHKEYAFPGYRALRMFILLPLLNRKLQPDAVLEPAHFGPFNLPKHIKRITIIHDLTPIKFPKWHHFHSQMLQRIFLPGILKRADLIITNSQNTRNDVIKYSPQAKNKTVYIYLGKDKLFKPTFNRSVLKRYGINKPYFLYVGTIEPRKNLITLLDAYQRFRMQDKPKYQLIIVGGKGWKSGEFYKRLNKHPFKTDIILPGYVPREELPIFYSEAGAFIYPSYYEGFGFPLLEALACGAACITSNSSSLPEVGGNAALYFNPASAEELYEKMHLIISDHVFKMKMKNLAIEQAKKFTWENYAKEFIRVIEEKFD